jgi:hypothetical protein
VAIATSLFLAVSAGTSQAGDAIPATVQPAFGPMPVHKTADLTAKLANVPVGTQGWVTQCVHPTRGKFIMIQLEGPFRKVILRESVCEVYFASTQGWSAGKHLVNERAQGFRFIVARTKSSGTPARSAPNGKTVGTLKSGTPVEVSSCQTRKAQSTLQPLPPVNKIDRPYLDARICLGWINPDRTDRPPTNAYVDGRFLDFVSAPIL